MISSHTGSIKTDDRWAEFSLMNFQKLKKKLETQRDDATKLLKTANEKYEKAMKDVGLMESINEKLTCSEKDRERLKSKLQYLTVCGFIVRC